MFVRIRKMLVSRPDNSGLCGKCCVLNAFSQQETFRSVQVVYPLYRPRCFEQQCTLAERGVGHRLRFIGHFLDQVAGLLLTYLELRSLDHPAEAVHLP